MGEKKLTIQLHMKCVKFFTVTCTNFVIMLCILTSINGDDDFLFRINANEQKKKKYLEN